MFELYVKPPPPYIVNHRGCSPPRLLFSTDPADENYAAEIYGQNCSEVKRWIKWKEDDSFLAKNMSPMHYLKVREFMALSETELADRIIKWIVDLPF